MLCYYTGFFYLFGCLKCVRPIFKNYVLNTKPRPWPHHCARGRGYILGKQVRVSTLMELWPTVGNTYGEGIHAKHHVGRSTGLRGSPSQREQSYNWGKEVRQVFQEVGTSPLRSEGKGRASRCWREGDWKKRRVVEAESVASSSKTWKGTKRSIWHTG